MFKHAQKIWIDTPEQLNVYADFVERFTVVDRQTPVLLTVSADSHYAVTVNGQPVFGNQFADFPQYKVADTYDITALVHEGENELLVTGYCQGESSLVYRVGEAGVLFEVTQGQDVLCCSNRDTRCRPGAGYQSGKVERITLQLSFSFRYDATASPEAWRPCVVREGYAKIYPRPCPNLQLLDRVPATIVAQGFYQKPQSEALPCGEYMKQSALVTLKPAEMGFDLAHTTLPDVKGVTLTNNGGDGVFLIVELPQEEAGLLDLEFELPEEGEVLVGFGEHLDNLRVMTAIDGRQFAVVYKAKKGENRFVHRFKRLAGRYLQVHFPGHTATVRYIGLRPTVYPVTDRGGLVCADRLHQRIYEVAKHTLHLCMHEHFEDCPWREQALYGMDSRVEMLCAYRAFGDHELAKASLRLLALSQRENGHLELCAPAEADIYIPSFNLCFVISSAEYLQQTGDTAFLAEIYPVIERLMQMFTDKMTPQGVIAGCSEPEAWNLYEWAPGLDGRPAHMWPPMDVDFVDEEEGKALSAPLNAYFLMALRAYEEIRAALGQPTEPVSALRQSVAAAAERLFWNEPKGCYASYREGDRLLHTAELTQALFLCAGVVPPEKQPALRRKLQDGADWVPMTTGSMIHKYDALMQEPEMYAAFVMDDVARLWGGMLAKGATSFWETFNGAAEYTFGGAGSLCHGWAALPIYVYYKYGVDAGLAGFSANEKGRRE